MSSTYMVLALFSCGLERSLAQWAAHLRPCNHHTAVPVLPRVQILVPLLVRNHLVLRDTGGPFRPPN